MTKRVTLQSGDLVCYNVSRRKNRGLAHIVEVRHPKQRGTTLEDSMGSIFVLWIKVGEYMPPVWYGYAEPGQIAKHHYTSAFEKVSE